MVWQTANASDPYDTRRVYNYFKDIITCISWHPELENMIAIGTYDGKVVVQDVSRLDDKHVVSPSFHLKTVYSLQWARSCSATEAASDSMVLYSVGGEGNALMHDPKLPYVYSGKGFVRLSNAQNVAAIIVAKNANLSREDLKDAAELSWSHDKEFVAYGTARGLIYLFTAPNMRHLVTVSVYTTPVHKVCWAPPIDESCTGWLATMSSNENVNLFDLAAYLEPSGEAEEKTLSDDSATTAAPVAEVPVVRQASRTLVGHQRRVTCIAWSPTKPGHLVSASCDGSVQVWDAFNETGLVNYRGHNCIVLSVAWSTVCINGETEERIYSGGQDFAIHAWRPSQQKFKVPSCQVTVRPKRHVSQNRKKSKLNMGPSDVIETSAASARAVRKNIEEEKTKLLSSMGLNAGGDTKRVVTASAVAVSDNTSITSDVAASVGNGSQPETSKVHAAAAVGRGGTGDNSAAYKEFMESTVAGDRVCKVNGKAGVPKESTIKLRSNVYRVRAPGQDGEGVQTDNFCEHVMSLHRECEEKREMKENQVTSSLFGTRPMMLRSVTSLLRRRDVMLIMKIVTITTKLRFSALHVYQPATLFTMSSCS